MKRGAQHWLQLAEDAPSHVPMDTNKIKNTLNNFRTTLSQHITVDDMVIFGSYMNGKATRDSDIDVVVISRDFNDMDEDERLDILYDASVFMRPEIHPWGFTREELNQADKTSALGQARIMGIRFRVSD
jgi:hypothetical protein